MLNKKENDKNKENARKVSIYEGCFSAFSSGLGDNYIIPFAQELLAKSSQIGFLSAFPNLVSPLAQFFGSRLMEKYSRKNIVLKSVILHALIWIVISLIGILAYFKIANASLPIFLIIGYSILAIFGGISGPAWFSWMGDLVEDNHRGRYFSIRNTITGTFSMLAFLLAAFFLDYFKTKGIVMIAFSILFAGAFLFRFIALFFFKRQYDPPFKVKKEDYYFSFWDFLKKFTNFTKFSVFLAVFNFSTTIAGPFFALYMLRELHFSYITFMIISLSSTIFYLILTPLAGKFSDKYGNIKLIWIAIVCFSIYPILWIYISKPIYLIFINQLVGGIASAAWSMSTTNFIYDTVTPARRAICVSYTNILVGIGIFLGAITGGLMLDHLAFLPWDIFFFVFGFSAALRIASSLIFLPSIKEIRAFEEVPKPILIFFHPWKILQMPLILAKRIPERIEILAKSI